VACVSVQLARAHPNLTPDPTPTTSTQSTLA
jgi:hypothetical protein